MSNFKKKIRKFDYQAKRTRDGYCELREWT
jgi:hypothetical protein